LKIRKKNFKKIKGESTHRSIPETAKSRMILALGVIPLAKPIAGYPITTVADIHAIAVEKQNSVGGPRLDRRARSAAWGGRRRAGCTGP
jgi:hypothetical protein